MLFFFIIFPLFSLILYWFFKKEYIFFIISILEMFISFYILLIFNSNNIEYQFRNSYFFLNMPINFLIDGINLPLILITTLIIPIILFIREKNNKEDYLFQIKIIITEVILLGIFIINDILYFYTLFELILLPMFIIIIKYGSRYRKIEASYKLFLYTFLGSLLLLIGIILLFIKFGSSNNELLELQFSFESFSFKFLLALFFFISFAVKVPVFPFHLWLPEAHTEAPTTGSVLLAAILLKLGIFGIVKYNFSFFSYVNYFLSPFIFTLAIIGILYSCFLILRLVDIKKIIAYSSIIHMNYVIIGLFSFDIYSLIGSYYTVISHAFISSSLFLLVGVLYRRYHTRNLLYYKGLFNFMPLFSFFFFIFIVSNFSLPLTSSFPGEFLLILGSINHSILFSFLLLLLLFFSTAYNIILLNKLIFGQFSIYLSKFRDLSFNEFLTLFPFFFFNFFFGFYCKPLLDISYLYLYKLFLF